SVQAVLPVANASVRIEFDGFAGEPPFTALNRRCHRVDTASSDLAIGATSIQPLLGQFGGNRYDLQLQALLLNRRSRGCSDGARSGRDAGAWRGYFRHSAWHQVECPLRTLTKSLALSGTEQSPPGVCYRYVADFMRSSPWGMRSVRGTRMPLVMPRH